MAICNLMRAIRREERGSAIMLVAPMTLVLAGMAAVGVDMMNAYTTQERLRTVAEAAATAAVSGLPDEDDALSVALEFGEKNLPANATGTVVSDDEVEFGHWDEETRSFELNPATEPVNAIRATASLTEAKGNPLVTWFGSVLGVTTFDVASSATAFADRSGIPCILALDPSADRALEVRSNAVLDLPNCEVHARSTSSSAIRVSSNAIIEARRTCVRGNAVELGTAQINPDAETNCETSEDPFAAVAAPTVGACNYNNKVVDNQTVTIFPGVYCGGINIKNNAHVTFSPGVYIIKDGKFDIDSNAAASGDGVGFYLTGSSALLEFDSNSTVNFTAADSGPLAGMLFFQDRNYGGEHKFDSNAATMLDGAMYFPNATFTSNSNTTMGSSSSCLMLVAKRITFDSNAGVNMSSDYNDCPWTPGMQGVARSKLVA